MSSKLKSDHSKRTYVDSYIFFFDKKDFIEKSAKTTTIYIIYI